MLLEESTTFFSFIPTIYLCFEEISFCMEFKNQDLKACVEKQKNQNLALSNKWVDRLLRQVVGSKVGTV